MPNSKCKRLPRKQIPRLNKKWRNERTYPYNHFSALAIDEPLSYTMEPIEVLMVKRQITKHCLTLPFKLITLIEDMSSMFPRPIDTDLSPQINPMKHYISINGLGNFLDNPKLTNDTIQCMFLYYVETYKRHRCHPHCPPCNAVLRKVA